jgi:GTP-binding protein
MSIKVRNDIRNIAIIAHVDHGKTTLVDGLLKAAGTAGEMRDRVMDSGDLERERGITILAKNTSIRLPDLKINIVDTPGHMDFGGEVERTLQMVEGFLLLVDAAEGPLPGTRFVLQKALALNLKPMVLINKIDRKDADIDRCEEMVSDLFLDVAQNSEQLAYKVLYGSSRQGYVSRDSSVREGNMTPLFDLIREEVPAPTQDMEHLQLIITNLDHSDYLGRIGIGKVINGKIKLGNNVVACTKNSTSKVMKVTKLYTFEGLERKEVEEASFGDIVAVAGFEEEISIGTTICDFDAPIPVTYVTIDEPTLSIYLSVNDSPMFGREGKLLTSRQIRERLAKELKTNVALRVEDTDSPETFKVSGRGQLHLSVLVETMRREGFEVSLSAPEVIFKDIDGEKCEPMELLILDIQSEHQGTLMDVLGQRKALVQNLTAYGEDKVRAEFKIPARGLVGFRNIFLTETRGTGLMNSRFLGYEPYVGPLPRRTKGSMISMEDGPVTAYALDGLQPRGILFVKPGDEVYSGMVIGEHSRDSDLEVNPTKKKKLTNMRASGTDDAVQLTPPKVMTLEMCLDWINADELIEVTPKTIRLRKKYLKGHERKRFSE